MLRPASLESPDNGAEYLLLGDATYDPEALLAELVSGRHQRLGDAVLAAQVTHADNGATPELLSLYHLFGDPALVIQ